MSFSGVNNRVWKNDDKQSRNEYPYKRDQFNRVNFERMLHQMLIIQTF